MGKEEKKEGGMAQQTSADNGTTSCLMGSTSHGRDRPQRLCADAPEPVPACRMAALQQAMAGRRWGGSRSRKATRVCPPPPSQLLGKWAVVAEADLAFALCLMDGRHPASSAAAQSAGGRQDAGGLRNPRFTPAAAVDGLGPHSPAAYFFHPFFHFGLRLPWSFHRHLTARQSERPAAEDEECLESLRFGRSLMREHDAGGVWSACSMHAL